MVEPPAKRIKSVQELMSLINECYDLKYVNTTETVESQEKLKAGLNKIRETLEQTTSSSDVSFGSNRTTAKISWGKCLGLLLEDGPGSSAAIKVLTDRLSPGGGLL